MVGRREEIVTRRTGLSTVTRMNKTYVGIRTGDGEYSKTFCFSMK